ncbi:FxLYD domain-containing protein [Pseudenhygromyxa sp. WMMC2535]|uniref:FxLYD domain-containing protein n=1 Tax=Pseudenhygromyxa sp. WMMC2535 TaxID=2712867 RepID=UPI0015579070
MTICIGGCGTGSSKGADAGSGDAPAPPSSASVSQTAQIDHDEGAASSASKPPADPAPALEIPATFHRTRIAHGAGFWVLAEVHNDRDTPLRRVELEVSLLDAEGKALVSHSGGLARILAPDERAALTVLIPNPPPHESLAVSASGRALEGEAPAPPPLRLEYDPPQRADLGGWRVFGSVHNEGEAAVEGARVEILGFDGDGQLLGRDWFQLDAVAPGEAQSFDVGELRYDETPARFELNLRPPADPALAGPAATPG